MMGRFRRLIFGRRKLGWKIAAAAVTIEIATAVAIALANLGGNWGNGKPTRGSSASLFQTTAGGPLSAPSLSAF